jgi:hypothetical protein
MEPFVCFLNFIFVSCQNKICMSPVVGPQYGAMTEAAESLIAQLYSQGKLTTPRCKNL